MDAIYKGIRILISAALGFALTLVLLWGFLDAGAVPATAQASALAAR